MKHSSVKTSALTAAALFSLLALSAEASSVGLSTARQVHGSKHSMNPIHHLLFPADTYMIDDGTAEDAVGLSGGDIIALNEFAVIPGSETITAVDIAWGTPVYFDPTLDGLPYTVAVWSDPNGDGNPTDAILLTTATGVVSQQGTDTFINTSITPTTITTPNFFVGFLITQGDNQYPCAFDESDRTFPNRSYVAGASAPNTGNIEDLNDNDLPVATIESYGLIGNWLIRANTEGGGPDLTLAASKHRQGRKISVSLAWNATGSGQIDILRNGVVIATTDDDGSARDHLGTHTGTFFYQVCVADTSNCSNVARVIVQPTGE